MPSADCVKYLYLSLLDSMEKDRDKGADRHWNVAQYLRKEGKIIRIRNLHDPDDGNKTIIVSLVVFLI